MKAPGCEVILNYYKNSFDSGNPSTESKILNML